MDAPRLGHNDGLIIVDVQNDFCPGGALPVPNGDETVPILNQWILSAHQGGACIVASRDWHTVDHCSFQKFGGLWPVHCVQSTPGAEFHPGLVLPTNAHVISKATDRNRDCYSAFDSTGLAELLRNQGVNRIWVAGLALEYCVKATVLDGLNAGFDVHLISDATRSLTSQGGQLAVHEMKVAGCQIENGVNSA